MQQAALCALKGQQMPLLPPASHRLSDPPATAAARLRAASRRKAPAPAAPGCPKQCHTRAWSAAVAAAGAAVGPRRRRCHCCLPPPPAAGEEQGEPGAAAASCSGVRRLAQGLLTAWRSSDAEPRDTRAYGCPCAGPGRSARILLLDEALAGAQAGPARQCKERLLAGVLCWLLRCSVA